MSIRLGVNIDHVATIRNARGENHPDPYTVAKKVLQYGANSITIHLREDRRHIKDYDLKIISSNKKIPLNLEMASNNEMLKLALKYKPDYICIVPEKRNEVTTEGGLNLKKNKNKLKINKSEIYFSHYTNRIFFHPNFFFNFDIFAKSVGWENINNIFAIKYWLENFSNNEHRRITDKLSEFVEKSEKYQKYRKLR